MYLDQNNIAYTSSNFNAHKLDVDKSLAKNRIRFAGLSTSKSQIITCGEVPTVSNIRLKYPIFIKPKDRGGGLGISPDSIVHNFEDLCAQVAFISKR
ncbi:hypothetical protein KC930_00330 [Candidatus Saccharibacteria bacterium]|nr:hypothetical protein [Candidatus Saccharibacteria bacterium]